MTIEQKSLLRLVAIFPYQCKYVRYGIDGHGSKQGNKLIQMQSSGILNEIPITLKKPNDCIHSEHHSSSSDVLFTIPVT